LAVLNTERPALTTAGFDTRLRKFRGRVGTPFRLPEKAIRLGQLQLQIWGEVHHGGRFDRLRVLGFAIHNCLIDYKATSLDTIAAHSKQFFGEEAELYQQTDSEMIHPGHLSQIGTDKPRKNPVAPLCFRTAPSTTSRLPSALNLRPVGAFNLMLRRCGSCCYSI
jgi:hypothetical protein